MDLYRMSYISKNTIATSKEEIESEVKSILASATKNNPSMDITGALLFSGGYFCQTIEGPEDSIEELFETIQMDDRHGEITVLHFEEIEERGFSDWSMAFAGIEDTMRFDIDGIKESKDELGMRETGKALVAVLDELVNQHQAIKN